MKFTKGGLIKFFQENCNAINRIQLEEVPAGKPDVSKFYLIVEGIMDVEK